MRKNITLFFAFLFLITGISQAAIVDIAVVDFQFNPANANVVVGDVVRFHFNMGFHNAISTGVTIPDGAEAINSGAASTVVRTFDYTVTTAGTYNYYCIVHSDGKGNGMVGTFTASVVVPVTFSSFIIAPSADKKPVVSWQTVTEQNVSHFSVRSSGDGIHFSEIAKVNAKGNSNTVQQYHYTDESVSTKYRYLYYEIVTVDKDGKESYSAIKMFRTTFAANKLIVQLAPNPITKPGQLMIQFNAEKAGSMPVNVFDAAGKQVMKTTMTAMPGLNNAHLHVCDLPPGIYTLQFSYEGLRETKKIVVN